MKVLGILDSVDIYGKERANLEVYHILKEAGFDIFVASSEKANLGMKEELAYYPCHSFSFPRNIIGNFKVAKFCWNFLKIQVQMICFLHKFKPDFILIPTEWALTYLYLPLKLSKAKVIFRCGDDPISYRKKKFAVTKLYACIWKRFILKRVDVLVCNAKYIQKRLNDSGRIDRGFDKLIYNYPPVRNCCTVDDVQIKSEGKITFGFIGRIVPEKGVKELLEAAVILKRKYGDVFSIVIAGDTLVNTPYTNILTNIIKSNDINENIHFVGKISDVSSFYTKCDVICIPSIYEEPMANVVAESKSYHKPCIIFNQGGMPEIVENMKTGIVVDNVSCLDYANAMSLYLLNSKLAKEHGEQAYRSIFYLKLDYNHFFRNWIDIFKTQEDDTK